MRLGPSITIAGLVLLRGFCAVSRSILSDGGDQVLLSDENAAGRFWHGVAETKGDSEEVGLGGRLGSATTSTGNSTALPSFPDHQLRVTGSTSALCDTSVKQYSGYLDVADGKHLFFWFFEARKDPETASLMLWMNGGPACSSLASGLLLENGPCTIAEGGNDTVHNPYSWNELVNIIYVEQPVGTGYSYSSNGAKVDTIAGATVDLYTLITLFLKKYPQYAAAPFHVAGESFAGHFGPHLASYIHRKNREYSSHPQSDITRINLASLIIANGLTEPYSQFESIPDYMCGGSPYPYLEPGSMSCLSRVANKPLCLGLIDSCYKTQARTPCAAAAAHCWATMMPTPGNKINPYDIRVPCDGNTARCYRGFDNSEAWLNLAHVKRALGVDPDFKFEFCTNNVTLSFYAQGQAMLNSAALLPTLLDSDVRVLVFAGETDAMCNYMGIERWMTQLRDHRFYPEFSAAPSLPWYTTRANALAGEVHSAGGSKRGAGNYTFVRIYDAGHMAPMDQPEAALDMIERWVNDRPW